MNPENTLPENRKKTPAIQSAYTCNGARCSKRQCQEYQLLLLAEVGVENQALCSFLQRQGYRVDLCAGDRSGLQHALNENYQLILLAYGPENREGLSILRGLRSADKETPVILLSTSDEVEDRITGFHAGADDYLSQPLHLQELQLRIEVLLRRCYPLYLQEGGSELLDDRLKLTRKGKQVLVQREDREHWTQLDATPVEFELLWQLLKHQNDVLSRRYLYQQVLNREYSRYDRSLDMHVSNLRHKLKPLLPDAGLIKTVRGQGYRYR